MNENESSGPDYLGEASLLEFAKKKTLSICLDAVILEEYKFVNAVRTLESLLKDEVEGRKVAYELGDLKQKRVIVRDSNGKESKMPYVDFARQVNRPIPKDDDNKFFDVPYGDHLLIMNAELQLEFPDINDAPRRAFELAVARFTELVRIIKKAEPVLVMYEVKPGRADLIATVWLKKYADKLHEKQPEVAAQLMEWSEELRKEIIKASKDESEVAKIIAELEGEENATTTT